MVAKYSPDTITVEERLIMSIVESSPLTWGTTVFRQKGENRPDVVVIHSGFAVRSFKLHYSRFTRDIQ